VENIRGKCENVKVIIDKNMVEILENEILYKYKNQVHS